MVSLFLSLDIFIGYFSDKTGGDGHSGATPNCSLFGMRDVYSFSGAGYSDIAKPSLFFYCTGLKQAVGMGEEAFFHAGQKDNVEFQTLGVVGGHQRDTRFSAV